MPEVKILCGCPIYDWKCDVAKDYFDNLKQLSYPLDFVFVDNSESADFSEWIIKTYGFNVLRSPCVGTTRLRQCIALNVLRDYFLSGDWTHLFLLESDLIPRKNIVELLLEHNKDCVAAPYLLNKDKGLACVTERKFIANQGGWTHVFVKPGFLDGEFKRAPNGVGLGCVLIKRKVIEAVLFRAAAFHADTQFWEDVQKEGFEVFIDTGLMVRHYPNGYPDF